MLRSPINNALQMRAQLFWCVAALCVLWLALPVHAALDVGFYRVQHYTSSSGLETDSLIRMKRLSDGRLLSIGVRGSLTLFDGARFTAQRCGVAPLISTSNVVERTDGTLFGSDDTQLWRCAEGVLTRWTHATRIIFLALSPDQSELLFSARDGIWRASDKNEWRPEQLSSVASAIPLLPITRDQIWLGSAEGLQLLDQGSLRAHSDPLLAQSHIWSIERGLQGRLLVGTRGNGLVIIQSTGAVQQIGRKQGLLNDIVRAAIEQDGAIWMATAGGGVAKFEDGKVQNITTAQGLSSDTVTWLVGDEHGVLWAATAGGGLNRIWPSAFLSLRGDGSDNRIGFSYALHEDPVTQSLWIGSNQGLSRWDGHVFEHFGAPAGGQRSTVLSMLPLGEQTLLIGTRRGLAIFDRGRFTMLPGAEDALLPVMADFPGWGKLVALRARGVMRWQDDRLVPWLSLSDQQVISLADDPQWGLLIGTESGAYALAQEHAQDPARLFALIADNSPVHNVWRDGARLYFTGNGELRFIEREGSVGRIKLNTRFGDKVRLYNMGADHLGGVWITSQEGLLRVNRQSLRSAPSGARVNVVLFGQKDGLSASEFENSVQGMRVRGDGSMWLASTAGAMLLDPSALGRQPGRINLQITRVETETQVRTNGSDEHVDFNAPSQTHQGMPMHLAAGTRRVAIRFATLPASHSSSVQLRYRLLPIESDYRSDEGRREAVYGGLGPGDYQLELEGELPGLVSTRDRVQFAFTIAPTWSERGSVRLGVPVAVTLLGLSLVGLHIRSLRRQRRRLLLANAEQNRELERIARTDGLTQLANRRSFDAALAALMPSAQSDVGLAIIDIDHFKRYNDSLGHPAGDRCLQQIAKLLTTLCDAHPERMAARLGGEEFALLLRTGGRANLERLAEQTLRAVDQAAILHPEVPSKRVSLSIGLAYGRPGERAEDLYARADAALYRAKQNGRAQLQSDT